MVVRALVVCFAMISVVPRPASAEWQFTPIVGLTFKPSTTIFVPNITDEGVHRHFGGAVSLLSGSIFGVEGVFVYTPSFFEPDANVNRLLVSSSHSYALMGNFVATLPRRWTEYSLRPFVSGGVGLMGISADTPVFPFNFHLSGFNVGGGAVGFLSKRTGLRFDFRYFKNLHPTDEAPISAGLLHVRYMTASVGLVIRK